MRYLLLEELPSLGLLKKVVIESLDLALYRMLVEIDGEECLVQERKGKNLVRHSQNELRELLIPCSIETLVLRHQSAYDEMVGQPVRQGSNQLEVPLGKDLYPPLRTIH